MRTIALKTTKASSQMSMMGLRIMKTPGRDACLATDPLWLRSIGHQFCSRRETDVRMTMIEESLNLIVIQYHAAGRFLIWVEVPWWRFLLPWKKWSQLPALSWILLDDTNDFACGANAAGAPIWEWLSCQWQSWIWLGIIMDSQVPTKRSRWFFEQPFIQIDSLQKK